ncbi:hypothetical protein LT493_44075 [Streptomyces tricolor]|nr:hypothetical protein [Streptomyces tricolor]
MDDRDSWQASMRHIALEGRCFVLSASQYLRRERPALQRPPRPGRLAPTPS